MDDEQLASKIEHRAAVLAVQAAAREAVLAALPRMKQSKDPAARRAVRAVERALKGRDTQVKLP